jgi:superfamily II DNA helicase RecQ
MDSRKQGQNLKAEIVQCRYHLICLDPETITARDWRIITDDVDFRANLVLFHVDEGHLLFKWGIDFRKSFNDIGPFIGAMLPSGISIGTLSGTFQPGPLTDSICKNLGFRATNYIHIKQSNEHLNIQNNIITLTHGLGGYEFPDLMKYVTSHWKTIIFAESLELSYRIHVYLLCCLPNGSERLRRLHLYNALCWAEDNVETLCAFGEDGSCQIVISTIALAQGINTKAAEDCLQVPFLRTCNTAVQEKGWVGRDLVTPSCCISFVTPSTIQGAKKYMEGTYCTTLRHCSVDSTDPSI